MHKILRIAILIIFSHTVNAQTNNWRINLGVGFPEFTHIGVGYKFADKHLASFNYGFLPGFETTFSIFTAEHSYFLSPSKKFDRLKTWYFGQKITYYRETNTSKRFEYVFLGLDFGRQFNFSKTFGFCFDLGVAYSIIDEESFLDSSKGELNQEAPTRIFPNANIQLFYRL